MCRSQPFLTNNNALGVTAALSASLRYAALDIIAAGLGIAPVADSLREEAKNLLKNEESGYVREYLESL